MEVCIAIGLGLWFCLCGIVSYIHVDKTFRKNNKDEDK